MNELNIDRFTKALSEILSRKYDAKITVTATRKGETVATDLKCCG
jgi:hypothetical protein